MRLVLIASAFHELIHVSSLHCYKMQVVRWGDNGRGHNEHTGNGCESSRKILRWSGWVQIERGGGEGSITIIVLVSLFVLCTF